MSRRGRKNWSNLEINKRICKQLILHRIWYGLSQTILAEDIGTTFQQYQKIERCYNRIFAEQLVSICKNQGWKEEIICRADPEETLHTWLVDNYEVGENVKYPHKYNKIMDSWDRLDKTAQKNYYGEGPIPFVIDKIEKGN